MKKRTKKMTKGQKKKMTKKGQMKVFKDFFIYTNIYR